MNLVLGNCEWARGQSASIMDAAHQALKHDDTEEAAHQFRRELYFSSLVDKLAGSPDQVSAHVGLDAVDKKAKYPAWRFKRECTNRDPPQSYVQHEPIPPADPDDHKTPKDTGERTLDANGHELKDNLDKPMSGPEITTSEMAQVSLNGASGHVIDFGSGQGSIDTVFNENQLKHRLSQFQQQGQFPITLGVNKSFARASMAGSFFSAAWFKRQSI